MNPETEKTVEQVVGSEAVVQKSTAREYLESLVVTVILALFGTTFLVQAFKIPSSSMEDSLLIGDHLMVDKVGYAPKGIWSWMMPYQEVQRDQIVVFRYPREPATYFVKRIIGIPGDRIHLEDKAVFRNGSKLEEPYAVHKSSTFDEFRDNFPNFVSGGGFPDWMQEVPEFSEGDDIVVPPGTYFVMGDNRDLSSDSRYWGFVPRENIVGNPLILYWSFESSSDEYRETGLASSIGRLLDVLIHFPQKTRWSRMFRLVN
ncbi:MAG: signal peptidase I [Acidobacteria bacterium]|nr:signal peptidase I [Acidobacteriota bacterium]